MSRREIHSIHRFSTGKKIAFGDDFSLSAGRRFSPSVKNKKQPVWLKDNFLRPNQNPLILNASMFKDNYIITGKRE